MSGTVKRLGVVGWPVAHSLSPAIQSAALRAAGLGSSWRYQLLPVPPGLFDETVAALAPAGFAGVNVTIPHKQAALALAGQASARAWAIGAANVLLFKEDGVIWADNTDAPALTRAVGRHIGLSGVTAVVLGAGGSARGAAWALLDAGAASVGIWNRTAARARELVAGLGSAGGSAAALEALPAGPVGVLVNCTAAGLHGDDQLGQLGIDPVWLGCCGLVVDYVYRAGGETPLIAAARAAGVAAVGGIELLVGQGALSFELFTGLPAPLEAMWSALGVSSAP